MKKGILLISVLFALTNACVEQANFKAANADSQLVVEGLITDEPGPYTVKLSRSRKPLDFSATIPVSAIRVTISDDAGTSEVLTEVFAGTYQTAPTGIRGVVGRSYILKVETRDGKIYESIPEKITTGGSIDRIYTSLDADTQTNGTQKYHFKAFIDVTAPSNDSYYIWKYNAYYRVVTFPEQRVVQAGEGSIPSPRACSGYIYNGSTLDKIGACTCCICWPKLVNTSPLLSTSQIPTNGKYLSIEVGSVPIDYWMFYDKTMIEVKQLNISAIANKFWKTVKDQKDGGTSLFQPAIGQASSNVLHKNGNDQVQGLFYAAAVSVKRIFIDKSLIPSSVPIPDAPPPIGESCILSFINSSAQQPIGWQ